MLFSLLYCLKIYLGINYGIFTITLGILFVGLKLREDVDDDEDE